jgi:hypothetical protein
MSKADWHDRAPSDTRELLSMAVALRIDAQESAFRAQQLQLRTRELVQRFAASVRRQPSSVDRTSS